MNKLLFHENRLICTFIHSSINEILSLKDYSGIREVKVIFNLPYRFPPSQYVFRLISSNEYSLIMIGEGESTYSMIFPTCISVSETYFKTYGGLVILSVIFHDSHIEVRISSG
ncbi:MAG: hypothetical protein N3E39_01400 [Candidatus Methanomethylicia archaeon]|nr:hypothetical protein [Candidatus Methanomethylicia archaeon]